jgi:hypothetical protein
LDEWTPILRQVHQPHIGHDLLGSGGRHHCDPEAVSPVATQGSVLDAPARSPVAAIGERQAEDSIPDHGAVLVAHDDEVTQALHVVHVESTQVATTGFNPEGLKHSLIEPFYLGACQCSFAVFGLREKSIEMLSSIQRLPYEHTVCGYRASSSDTGIGIN